MTKAERMKAAKCSDPGDGGVSVYTLRDRDGESHDVVVCQGHGEFMPLIDGDLVTAIPGDSDLRCEFSK